MYYGEPKNGTQKENEKKAKNIDDFANSQAHKNQNIRMENDTSLDEKKIYRERLIEAYKGLINMHDDLFTSALNIAMAGALKEIDEVFDIGDQVEFDIELLEGTNDTNVNKFLELYEQIQGMMHSIANINAITEAELE